MDRQKLTDEYGVPELERVTNGVVVKMVKDTKGMPKMTASLWMRTWLEVEERVPAKVMAAKMARVVEKAGKLRREALADFLSQKFEVPMPVSRVPTQEIAEREISPEPSPLIPLSTAPPIMRVQRLTPQKRWNETEACKKKKERQLRVLEQKVVNAKRKLEDLGRLYGQYGIENVKKREARSVKTRKVLRQQKNEAEKQAKVSKMALEKLRAEKMMVDEKLEEHKKRLQRVKRSKKVPGQKKVRCNKRRKGMKKTGRKTGIKIEVEKLEPDELETKEKDGSYKEEVRMCVLELVGLEVATGKMADVMRTVGEMCGVKFSNLPTRSACQDIVDEGHVIAKKYIRSRVLERSNSFGVHKDGTTRRKVKILDTSVVTEEGESYSLGFSSVVSETGEAIAEDVKSKLEEVAGGADEEMMDVWGKLNYLMNDRAANEKKSNRILEEWRDEYLTKFGEAGRDKIHQLFCCAHVLLGFHSYVLREIKKLPGLESGEDKHPVTRMLRDAGDLFGPVGDHRGVRNYWEAYCLEKGIKSTIKSYKDNRFNGLFEISAQVFHHRKEFLHILDSLTSKNAKLTRLTNALHNSKLMTLIECFGLFFHKITGPFWTMVISKKTKFTTFRTIVQSLKISLEKFAKNPASLFDQDKLEFLPFSTTSDETKVSLSVSLKDGMSEVIRAMSEGMVTAMEAQLKDFMEDGVYGSEEEAQKIPQSAPLTNLVCERHFGHLDSSQKRRPSSTLHHHSSVILLKQTRKGLKEWYWQQTSAERKNLWKASKKEGKALRKKHVAQDRKAVMESLRRVKLVPLPKALDTPLKKGQMVAIACQDNWYPDTLMSVSPVSPSLSSSQQHTSSSYLPGYLLGDHHSLHQQQQHHGLSSPRLWSTPSSHSPSQKAPLSNQSMQQAHSGSSLARRESARGRMGGPPVKSLYSSPSGAERSTSQAGFPLNQSLNFPSSNTRSSLMGSPAVGTLNQTPTGHRDTNMSVMMSPSSSHALPTSPAQVDPFYTQGDLRSDDLLDDTWVTVFGFLPGASSFILQQFAQYGTILKHVVASECNWMHIQYQSKIQAKKALSKDGKVFAGCMKIGVTVCIEKNVMEEKENNVSSVLTPKLSKEFTRESGLTPIRPLTAAYSASKSDYEVLQDKLTPKRDHGLVSKLKEYMFGY